jgi:ATP-dependent Zn protease
LAGLSIQGQVPAAWQAQAAERVRDWINQCEREALLCLRTQSQALTALVNALLLSDTLDGDDVARIVRSCMHECAAPNPMAPSTA